MTPAELATAQAAVFSANADMLLDSARTSGWAWVQAHTITSFVKAELALAVTRLGGTPAKTRAALVIQLGSLLAT